MQPTLGQPLYAIEFRTTDRSTIYCPKITYPYGFRRPILGKQKSKEVRRTRFRVYSIFVALYLSGMVLLGLTVVTISPVDRRLLSFVFTFVICLEIVSPSILKRISYRIWPIYRWLKYEYSSRILRNPLQRAILSSLSIATIVPMIFAVVCNNVKPSSRILSTPPFLLFYVSTISITCLITYCLFSLEFRKKRESEWAIISEGTFWREMSNFTMLIVSLLLLGTTFIQISTNYLRIEYFTLLSYTIVGFALFGVFPSVYGVLRCSTDFEKLHDVLIAMPKDVGILEKGVLKLKSKIENEPWRYVRRDWYKLNDIISDMAPEEIVKRLSTLYEELASRYNDADYLKGQDETRLLSLLNDIEAWIEKYREELGTKPRIFRRYAEEEEET